VILCAAQDPCASYDDYHVIPFLNERLVNYTTPPGELPICDFLMPNGWYRMDGYVLASTNDPCGTNMNWYRLGTSIFMTLFKFHKLFLYGQEIIKKYPLPCVAFFSVLCCGHFRQAAQSTVKLN